MELYKFYNAENTLLYVGITRNFHRRFMQHVTTQSWWSDVARSEVDDVPDKTALLTERRLIRELRPLHNVKHAIRSAPSDRALVGNRVAFVLEELGVSRDELREHLGVSRTTMHRLISGEMNMTLPYLLDIASFLHCRPSHLLPLDSMSPFVAEFFKDVLDSNFPEEASCCP